MWRTFTHYHARFARRYMEMGPHRASLLNIGYEALQEYCPEKTFLDDVGYQSKAIEYGARFRGYTVPGWIMTFCAGIGELLFYITTMHRNGTWDVMVASAVVSSILTSTFNLAFCHKLAFHRSRIPLTAYTDLSEIHLTGVSYLRLKGLDVLALAQEKMAKDAGHDIPVASR